MKYCKILAKGGDKMKNKFFGYIPYDEEIFKELWNNATFVVDANILLNLYRYTKETQMKVLACLHNVSDRLWIPYNTAEEYFRNRMSVISEQNKIYSNIKSQFNFEKIKSFIDSIRHLTIEKEILLDIVEEYENKIKELLDKNNKQSIDFLRNDVVLKEISKLFEGKVGDEISKEKLSEMKKQIDKRYENNIPPGFEDSKSKNNGRKYGDCINWLEVINYAKDNKKNIIYITDDKKSDWMAIVNNKKVGPRSELLNEFYNETNGMMIYIYTTETFLEHFNTYIKFDEAISESVINEVSNFSSDTYENREEIDALETYLNYNVLEYLKNTKIEHIEHDYNVLNNSRLLKGDTMEITINHLKDLLERIKGQKVEYKENGKFLESRLHTYVVLPYRRFVSIEFYEEVTYDNSDVIDVSNVQEIMHNPDLKNIRIYGINNTLEINYYN